MEMHDRKHEEHTMLSTPAGLWEPNSGVSQLLSKIGRP